MQARTSTRRTTSVAARSSARVLVPALLAGALAFGPSPALAAEPVDLGGAYVLDDAGVLGGDRDRVASALDALFDELGAPLLVVIVETFDAPANGADWADESAFQSGLGDRDALLAIAVDDRSFGVFVGVDFPASDEALARAEADDLIPALRDDRWADGIVAYADRLRSESPGAGSDAGSGAGSILPLLLGALVVGGVVLAIVLVVRARRRAGTTGRPAGELSTAELEQAASRRLVELDDALTTSEQELGFAEAQFGAESTVAFRAALDKARALVTTAFRDLQSLDSGSTETPAPSEDARRAALTGILERCDEADDLLADQEEAFEALRAVEQDLPAALLAAQGAREAASATVAEAHDTHARVQAAYRAEAVSAIADAPEQLASLLALADAELRAAVAAQEAGATSDAAIEVRSAQLALAQLDSVATAVSRLDSELSSAREALAAQRADLDAGIATARELTAAQGTPPERTAALAGALSTSDSALSAVDDRHPVASLERLITADRALDSALDDARADAERRAAASAALERALASARSAILSAAEYITSHRGGVAASARGQLAEAQAQLELAITAREADPAAALTSAQRAHELARDALATAEHDVRGALAPQGSLGSLLGSGGSGGSRGGTGGSLVGGLLGGLLSQGGGSSRPRFGSTGSSGTRRSAPARTTRTRSPRPARASRPARTSRARSGRSRGGRF